MLSFQLMLAALPLAMGYAPAPGAARVGALARRPTHAHMLESGAQGGGGGMVDGQRIGPPPDLPSLLLNNRIVYLGMPIAAQVSELIVSELLFLQYDNPAKPITMYINSPGCTTEDGQPVGFETEAFAIADTMGYVQSPIQTVLVGKAYGLAALLLASGEKGKRTSLPYGTVMLHQPRGQQAQGQASDIKIKAKEVLLNRHVALEMMSQATGVSLEKLTADTNRCLYLGAQGALDYGIIDKIVEKVEKEQDMLKASMSDAARGLG